MVGLAEGGRGFTATLGGGGECGSTRPTLIPLGRDGEASRGGGDLLECGERDRSREAERGGGEAPPPSMLSSFIRSVREESASKYTLYKNTTTVFS